MACGLPEIEARCSHRGPKEVLQIFRGSRPPLSGRSVTSCRAPVGLKNFFRSSVTTPCFNFSDVRDIVKAGRQTSSSVACCFSQFKTKNWEDDLEGWPEEGLENISFCDADFEASVLVEYVTLCREEEIELELTTEIPCRNSEIGNLYSLLGKCKGQLPQSLCVYGHSGTGKSFVLQKILTKLCYRYAVVDCVQCYLPKLLYLCILTKLTGLDADKFHSSCDNILDFIMTLKSLVTDDQFVIVLDKCERLRNISRTILPAFARLQELTDLNVCVIMVSCVVPEKFYSSKGYFETIMVHFRQYSKEETYKILSTEKAWDSVSNVYKNYLSLFLNVFYSSCRNLHELKYMVNTNFQQHLQSSIISGDMDMHKLWQVVGLRLKASLEELYQRNDTSSRAGGVEENNPNNFALSFELPYYTKYYLIAAYLASYIPSKMDRVLFVKLSGRKKKRVVRSKNDVLSDMLLGPKPFTADRLTAIFYSIVGGEVSFTVNLSVQISFLVKLRLMTTVNNCLECPKYKCAVGLDFIKTIARTVSFDIVRFLFPK